MKNSMPQEIEVWYIIPTIRSHIANNLLMLDMSQKEIASTLGVTEAAVSQYIKKKRATNITFNTKIEKEIKCSSAKISKDRSRISYEINRILKILRKSEFLCKVHEKYGTISRDCKLCRC